MRWATIVICEASLCQLTPSHLDHCTSCTSTHLLQFNFAVEKRRRRVSPFGIHDLTDRQGADSFPVVNDEATLDDHSKDVSNYW